MPSLLLASLVVCHQAFDPNDLPREIAAVDSVRVSVVKGTAYVDGELCASLLDARLAPSSGAREIVIEDGQNRAQLRTDDKARVPFRDVAKALGRPFEYEAATHSLLIPRGPGRRLLCVPLPTERPGASIASVSRGKGPGGGVRVQLQANVGEGRLVVQLRDKRGAVLAETEARGAKHYYGETLVFLGKQDTSGTAPEPASVAAFVRLPDGTTSKAVTASALGTGG